MIEILAFYDIISLEELILMKKIFNLITLFIISLFVFNMSAMAFDVDSNMKADGSEYAITGSAAEGKVTGCSSNSSNVSVRYDSATNTCWVKTNSKTESAVTGSVHLELAPGTYGVGGGYDYEVKFKSANNTSSNNANSSSKSSENKSEKQKANTKPSNKSVFLNFCDVEESPQIVASFRLIGIFITIIKIVAPIIIIVMGMIDLSKAVINDKSDILAKQLTNFLKRSIACLLIFFAPAIILDLFRTVDGWDQTESDFSTCLVCFLGDSSCPNVGFIKKS